MVQQKLRSKAGCLTCRKRRKKCDEKKPLCEGCAFYQLACVWPTSLVDRRHSKRSSQSNIGHTQVRSMSIVSGAAQSPSTEIFWPGEFEDVSPVHWQDDESTAIQVYSPELLLSAQVSRITLSERNEQLLFNLFRREVIPVSIRVHAASVYHELFDMYQAGFQIPNVMKLFLGLACLHLAVFGRVEVEIPRAMAYYNSAIKEITRMIDDAEVRGTEDWLMIAAVLMMLFEERNPDLSCNALVHLQGLAQLFKLRRRMKIKADVRSPFHRIAAEAFMYNVTHLSLLDGQVADILESFDWTDLDDYEQLLPSPNASCIANSPILGVGHGLHSTIFNVTKLRRLVPLNVFNASEAAKLQVQLVQIQCQLSQSIESSTNRDECQALEGGLLYALAAQIFLYKIRNSEVTSTHPVVRQLVCDAVEVLRRCIVAVSCASYFCWPVTILACTGNDPNFTSLISAKLEEMWTGSHSGHTKRTKAVIERIWRHPYSTVTDGGDGVNSSHDILDLLLDRDGLSSKYGLTHV